MATSKPSSPKGTRDFGPIQMARRSYLIEIIKKNFNKYGFQQIETPSMENLSTLTGKYGEEGDQLLFKILNSGDFLKNTTGEDFSAGSQHILPRIAEKGLRYDLTVPFARFIVQHQNELTFPFKRFQIQPVWRADRPQKGRYREFYQCDADIIGTNSLWCEAELSLMIADTFKDLNFNSYQLKVNHREILNGLAEYAGLKGKEIPFCIAVDKLDKIGLDSVKNELLTLGAQTEALQIVLNCFSESKSILEKVQEIKTIIGDNKGLDALMTYSELLKKYGYSDHHIHFDPALARGLTYYTGLIFEVKATDVKIGSITGGGRYDNLTGVFGLEGISGVGISFGLDRIYDVLEEKGLFPEGLLNPVDVLISHFDQECFEHGLMVLSMLRNKGIKADIYPESVKIKKQFNYADKLNVPYVIVIGTEEIEKKAYSLKDMQAGSQKLLTLDEIVDLLS